MLPQDWFDPGSRCDCARLLLLRMIPLLLLNPCM